MNLYDLKPGDRVRVRSDSADITAEVVLPTEDGRWILVRYVESPGSPELVGTQDVCSDDEVVEALARPGRS